MKSSVKITLALSLISITIWKLSEGHDVVAKQIQHVIAPETETATTWQVSDAKPRSDTTNSNFNIEKHAARDSNIRFLGGGEPPSNLTDEQATQEIAILERLFSDEDMINRLNANSVTQLERERYGALMQRVASLKEELLVREFKKIDAEFQSLVYKRSGMANHDLNQANH